METAEIRMTRTRLIMAIVIAMLVFALAIVEALA